MRLPLISPRGESTDTFRRGNLLRTADGGVALLDFGLCKELSKETCILFAKLTCALARRDAGASLPLLSQLGLVVENASPEFMMTIAYIIFDTRMDIPEAHMSPLDAGAGEMRAARIRTLPEELFMLVRCVTIFRGMNAMFGADVSAAKIWEPFARKALLDAGIQPPPMSLPTTPRGGAISSPAQPAGGSIADKMARLVTWLRERDLPCDRPSLTPLAMAGLTTVAEIAAASDDKLAAATQKFFTAEQRNKCRALARAEMAERARVAAARSAKPALAAAAAKKAAPPSKKAGLFTACFAPSAN